MTHRLLKTAVVLQLMEAPGVGNGGLGLTAAECGLAPVRGRPPAMCGERYVGVWRGPRTTGRTATGLEEFPTINVTVTARISGMVPDDRLGVGVVDPTGGFDDLCDQIAICLHRDLIDGVVTGRANALIGTNDGDGGPFTQSLQFLGDDGTHEVDSTWFHAVGDDEEIEEDVGIVCNLRFGECRRDQNFYSSQGVK